tara:strand:- start:861 stop:1457 length:597 start_codon:yes stop_codon:yes gene_type:complete
MERNILIILVLKEYLNQDLARYILNLLDKIYKDELFFSSQKFWIENNFYNWLNHDLVIRKAMRLDMLDAYESPLKLYNFYRDHNSNLGLINFRRRTSLTKCFNGEWWRSTPKSFVFWDNIHRIIKCRHIRVYEIDNRYHYDENDINYYFENDLLYEKFGLERIRYINNLYNKTRLYGDILFEDASFIFVDNGNIEYVE